MKILIVVVLLLFTLNPLAQDTIYYNSVNKKTRDKENAELYRVIFLNPDKSYTVREHDMGDTLKSEKNYRKYSENERILHGKNTQWYSTGEIYFIKNFNNNKLDGLFRVYWINGTLKREETYKQDKFVNGQCYDSSGNKTTYFPFESWPVFPGGEVAYIKYLQENVQYPPEARENAITGTVYIIFEVNNDGHVQNAKVYRSVYPVLDLEALRAVKSMPAWNPGTYDGKIITYKLVVPIKFMLEVDQPRKKRKK